MFTFKDMTHNHFFSRVELHDFLILDMEKSNFWSKRNFTNWAYNPNSEFGIPYLSEKFGPWIELELWLELSLV